MIFKRFYGFKFSINSQKSTFSILRIVRFDFKYLSILFPILFDGRRNSAGSSRQIIPYNPKIILHWIHVFMGRRFNKAKHIEFHFQQTGVAVLSSWQVHRGRSAGAFACERRTPINPLTEYSREFVVHSMARWARSYAFVKAENLNDRADSW